MKRIQIDEPNASAFYGQEKLFYEATRRSIKGITGVELGMHICFSNDYGRIAKLAEIPEIKFLSLELANRDTADHEVYRSVINTFEQAGYFGSYALGMTDVHVDSIESAELISERILYCSNIIDPSRIEPAHDCGLRSRTLPIAIEKTKALVMGAEMAREKYR